MTGTAAQIADWTFASGRAAALEARMMPRGFFESIVASPDADQVLPRLGDTLLGDRLGSTDDLRTADRAINKAYAERMRELQRHSPDPRVAELLLVRGELRSLKNYVKRTHLNVEVSALPTRYGEEQWDRLWNGLLTDLPPLFGRALADAQAVAGAPPEEPRLFDAAFDSASLRELCREAPRTGSELIAAWWRRRDTAKGVEILWRARELGWSERTRELLLRGRRRPDLFARLRRAETDQWPALLAPAMEGLPMEGVLGAEGAERIREFVQAADRWTMDLAREARYVAFGPERVFGCLLGLEAEAFNMGVAVVGLANEVAPDRLRRHLRACYA